MTRKTFFTNISERDIASGEPTHARRCPLARSLQRKFPNATPSICGSVATFGRLDLPPAIALLSPAAQAWVSAFDRGRPCAPARFQLTVVSGSIS